MAAGAGAAVLLVVGVVAFGSDLVGAGPDVAAPSPSAPASARGAEPAPAGPLLSWAPPELTAPETVLVSQDDRDLRLEADRD